MRIEVHVHGTLHLCKGVTLTQVENGLRKWLDYLDVETITESRSLEQEEPGIVFHRSDRVLEICWTGEVGRNFVNRLQETLLELGPLTERASEVEITFYYEDGRDEYQLLFVGPTAQAIHQVQRRRMIEDVSGLLSRHFGEDEVKQVTGLVNELFDHDWERTKAETSGLDFQPSGGSLLHFRKKHLH
jgi:hypothetical protein